MTQVELPRTMPQFGEDARRVTYERIMEIQLKDMKEKEDIHAQAAPVRYASLKMDINTHRHTQKKLEKTHCFSLHT